MGLLSAPNPHASPAPLIPWHAGPSRKCGPVEDGLWLSGGSLWACGDNRQDLCRLDVASAADCCAACTKHPLCTAFSWTSTTGDCSLHDKLGVTRFKDFGPYYSAFMI